MLRVSRESTSGGPGPRPRGTLLVYGAGRHQVPVLEACRRDGWRTIAVDRDPEAPGAALADRFLCHSLREDARIRRAVEAEDLAGVVARVSDEAALASACGLARDRGLVAPCPELLEAATHKRALARHCARAGLPTPRRFEADDPIDFSRQAVVVRPDVSVRGKLGIHRVRAAGVLAERIDAARRASGNAEVDLSEWVDGVDVSLLVRLDAEGARGLAIWDEWVALDAAGRIRGVGVGMPASVPLSHPTVVDCLAGLARAFPGSRGLVALSLRIEPSGRTWLIEIHLGLGGDGIAEQLLPAALPGWDAFALLVRTQAGEVAPVEAPAAGASSAIRPCALLRADADADADADGDVGWRLVRETTPRALRARCAATLPEDWEPPRALSREPFA